MKYLVSSARQRLDAIRDLKAAGFTASGPVENDTDSHNDHYTLNVTAFPPGQAERVDEILRDVDPQATQADRLV
jgi:hypothetical protein